MPVSSSPLGITPQDVRAFANLPREVPDTLLEKHIGVAMRDMSQRVGVSGIGIDKVDEDLKADWTEALIVRALASVFPWLHTFALSGAAKAGRLEGSVEYRFLDADDVTEAVDKLTKRFDALTSRIKIALPSQKNTQNTGFGSIDMIAI